MKVHEYLQSQLISAEDYHYYALIMAAMRQSDTDNLEKLKKAFPIIWKDLETMYNMTRNDILRLARGEVKDSAILAGKK